MKGFTLSELLLVVALLAIVLVMALPISTATVEHQQTVILQQALLSALSQARTTAFSQGRALALTPLETTEDWSEGAILFVDNPTHRYREQDELIARWHWPKHNSQITWKGFRSNQFLVFSPSLQQAASSGHFLITDKWGNTTRIVLNRLGRANMLL